jgi:hypothetical protein
MDIKEMNKVEQGSWEWAKIQMSIGHSVANESEINNNLKSIRFFMPDKKQIYFVGTLHDEIPTPLLKNTNSQIEADICVLFNSKNWPQIGWKTLPI